MLGGAAASLAVGSTAYSLATDPLASEGHNLRSALQHRATPPVPLLPRRVGGTLAATSCGGSAVGL